MDTSLPPVEAVLREELALGDAALASTVGIVRHLLISDDSSIFSDQIMARVRGMVDDVSRQLSEELFGRDGSEGAADARQHLNEQFLGDARVLEHVHALALEFQLTERLNARNATDPVVSSVLQSMLATKDAQAAEVAMQALAAQARFMQQMRRMELPLTELPRMLLRATFQAAAAFPDVDVSPLAALQERAEGESTRVELMTQVAENLGSNFLAALDVDRAGVSLFLTALAMGSGQPRETVTLSTTERQLARLAIALRAAGLKPDAIEQQFLYLHPEVSLPPNFDHLTVDRAAMLLADSNLTAGS